MSPTGDVASTMLGTIVPHTALTGGSSHSKEPSMRALVTIAAEGSFSALARADLLGPGPYLAFAPEISMNQAGQVAVLVTNQDATFSIVRLDDSGAVEIARSSPALLAFSAPTLNDSGVAAFKAQVPATGTMGVYTASGGALTNEGVVPPCDRVSGAAPVI